MIKDLAYIAKEWIKAIFIYPRDFNLYSTEFDYDKYWQKKRNSGLGSLSVWQKERADFILDFLKKEHGEITIVDVGCGDGSILSYLKEKSGKVKRCVGYDNSELALKKAFGLGIETHYIDITNNDYQDLVNADYFLLLEILEHIPDSESLLRVALSKSSKGVFFSFPNTGYLKHRLRLLFGRFPLQWYSFPGEHLRFWTYTDLKWWVQAMKLEGYIIHPYQGIPVLKNIFPGVFSAGFIVFVPKKNP